MYLARSFQKSGTKLKTLTPKTLIIRLTLAIFITLAVMFLCSLIGSRNISPADIINGLKNNDAQNTDLIIYFRVRVPRIILAALVGAALAASGVVFQALLRNPLADPYILGISSGAGLGAMIAVITGLTIGIWTPAVVSFAAFTGAMITVWLVWIIGNLTSKGSVTGLLLAGVVINSFFSAMIMFLTSIAKSDQVYSTIFWLMGNITEESKPVIITIAAALAISLTMIYLISPRLNILSFGDDDAKSIGINPGKTRFYAFAVAAFITSLAVSISGLIGFAGLIVPHAVRIVFGPDHRQLTLLSAAAGAAFLVTADTIARTLVAPAQLPVGVVTAITGAPVFLILLIKFSQKNSPFKS